MKTILSILLLTITLLQHTTAQEEILAKYIEEGLESNLSLLQREADYERNLQSLKAAKGLFYPDISMNARYSLARGGRTLDFPVGDLLNPVYSTLNSLTQSEQFPQVENQEIPFYRPTEQVTSLNIMQPLVNPQIIYNYRIEKDRTLIGKTDVTIYKRELIRELKLAYYNFLKTEYLTRLINETESLLLENLRVSNSLFKNDKVTHDVVYRSEAELQKVYLAYAEAEKSKQTARAYFNFLLNKPLNSPIEVYEYDEVPELRLTTAVDTAIRTGIETREEMSQLERYADMNENYTRLLKSNNYPTLSFGFNYGFQGEQYSFTSEDDFLLASIVLRWNLFQGMKNRASVQEAKIASHKIELIKEETEKQIELQIIQAYYDLAAADKAIHAAMAQTQAAEKAFKVIQEKFRIGQSQLIEYTDARTTLTGSKQNVIIAVFDFKIQEAELERAIAQNTIY